MSYDLTIRSDESYSRTTAAAALEAYIHRLPGVKRNGKNSFALDGRQKKWMEIDLEVVDEEGDNIQTGEETEINCVRLHIPYAFAETIEEHCLPIALSIAGYLDWELYDEQSGEVLPNEPSQRDEPQTGANKFDSKDFVGNWVSFPFSFSALRMEYKIFEDGRFEATLIDELGKFDGSANGTWKVAGNAIEWTYEKCQKMPRPRRPQLDKVLRCDNRQFTLLEGCGSETEFWRVMESREVSRKMQFEHVRRFLERLIKIIEGGFATREIDSLMKTIEHLDRGKPVERIFKITTRGIVAPLVVRILKEDGKSGTLSFIAPLEPVEKIEGEILAVGDSLTD